MAPSIDVPFTRNSGHRLSASECPLCANSGQSVSQRQKSRDRFRVRLSETSVHLSHSVAPVSLGERNADYAFCEAFNKGACVLCPTHNRTASHRCELHDDREWRQRVYSRRKLSPLRGRTSARQCAARCQRRTPLCRPVLPEAPSKRAPGRPCLGHQGEG